MDKVYEDYEDWDSSKGAFSTHMLAGSMAGVAEHTVSCIDTTMHCYCSLSLSLYIYILYTYILSQSNSTIGSISPRYMEDMGTMYPDLPEERQHIWIRSTGNTIVSCIVQWSSETMERSKRHVFWVHSSSCTVSTISIILVEKAI